jgi:hypothetical protein
MDKFIESELEGFCDNSPTLNNMLHMPENLNEDVVLKESITDTIMKSVKKTKHTLLLVIPPDMYETISQDNDILNSYISQQLAPWNEDTLVEPYVVLDKEEAIEEYEENKEDYPDINEYYMKYHGGHLNEFGEVVSQINENGIYSSYVVEKCGLEVGEIMNMILSEEINFKYIVHNGVLCDKENSDSANALSESDPNSYFVVITVSD